MKLKLIFVVLLLSLSLPKIFWAQSNEIQDSVFVHDSTAVVKIDTLKPIFSKRQLARNFVDFTISKHDLDFTDYIHFGDWLYRLPGGYLQNMGVMGFPNEVDLGTDGNSNVGIIYDGVDFSDRLGGGIMPYSYRTEIIDTLQLMNNSSTILLGDGLSNKDIYLIPQDKIAIKPLTRIRYYQAPNEEGYIDAQFNMLPYKRLNISLGVTNRSVNSDYSNSEYGQWLGSVHARYMPSNKFNFVLNYNYNNINSQLNGGVDYEEIISSSKDPNSVLYSSIEAPVKYPDRYQKITENKLVFKTISILTGGSPFVTNVYYFNSLKEFRQNETANSSSYKYIKRNTTQNTLGINVKKDFSFNGFDLKFLSGYEKTNYNIPEFNAKSEYSKFNVSGSISKNISNVFNQSAVIKYLSFNGQTNLSYGFITDIKLTNRFRINGNISMVSQPLSIYESYYLTKDNIQGKNLELSLIYNNKKTYGLFKVFVAQSSNEVWNVRGSNNTFKNDYVNLAFNGIKRTNGISLLFNTEFSNIRVETNAAYYLEKNEGDILTVPEWKFTGGIYYVDTLFNRNLKMKGGFNVYAQGKQSYRIYDFEKMLTAYFYLDNAGRIQKFGQMTEPSYQIDLFFAGKIRNRATVYFVLENLTDNKYFVVPYYPRKGLTFRFGFAWELIN